MTIKAEQPLGGSNSWHFDIIWAIEDWISSMLSDPIQTADESFDSMTLTLTMARAPIVDEDQLWYSDPPDLFWTYSNLIWRSRLINDYHGRTTFG